MMYLPRICEHCINPSCVASCPSGRDVQARGGRHRAGRPGGLPRLALLRLRLPLQEGLLQLETGKAEKCKLCYPRIEAGLPTICSETCVGRLRHLGIVLIDTDRVEEAASIPDEQDLLEAQLDLILDPEDPEVREQAAARRHAADWIEAARRSPVYAMARSGRIALPLHPEYRTLPMVWYVPPLSPVRG